MKTRTFKAMLTALILMSMLCATAAAENQPPVATIENTSTWGETPYGICVSGEYESYDPDGTIVSYDWDFGDGGTSTEGTLWYTYNNSGNYTLSLTVTDNEGATGYAYVNVTIVPGDNPITDHGMKAYVWCSNAEYGWNSYANGVESQLSSQGFDVIRHTAPSQDLIYQTIEDNDVKIYWGLGHGSDTSATTGDGSYYAVYFGSSIEEREYPLTIGIFQHCGEYQCYTPGRWLQESTQGNDDVVAQRFYGDGWCGEASGSYEGCEDCLASLGSGIGTLGYGEKFVLYFLNKGYTYEDAADRTSWELAEGRKQGNRDLRYPQFCGDVNYDMVVDPADAALLQNHINDPVTYPIHSDWDADVNGDGSVDIYDANLLEYHVSDPAEYRLKPLGWFAGPCIWYDTNGDPGIQNDEVLNAIGDYYSGLISLETMNVVIACQQGPCDVYDTNGTPGIQVDEVLDTIGDYYSGLIDLDTMNAVIDCYNA